MIEIYLPGNDGFIKLHCTKQQINGNGSGKIMKQIREAKYAMHKKIFRYPNTMIMPLGVWSKIQR